MKRLFAVIAALLVACMAMLAQDRIVTTDGAKIKARIVKDTAEEIQFKRWSDLNGPTETLSKSKIASIQFASGKKWEPTDQERQAFELESKKTTEKSRTDESPTNELQRNQERDGIPSPITNTTKEELIVDFKVNDQGAFVREDSDKNYYVFNFEGMSKNDLEKKFQETIHHLAGMPPYFMGPEYSTAHDNSIEGTLVYPVWKRTTAHQYTFSSKVEFKDNKMRINPPTLKIRRVDSIKDYFPEDYFRGSTEDIELKKAFNHIANSTINLFLTVLPIDWRIVGDHSVIQDPIDENEQFFKLRSDGSFVFSNGEDHMGFKIVGLSKESIRENLRNALNAYDKRNIPVIFGPYNGYSVFDTYEDPFGIGVRGYIDINLPTTGLLIRKYNNPCRLEFMYYYWCVDNEVIVYVPVILSVQTQSDNKTYEGPLDYLSAFSYVDKDGFRKQSSEGVDSLNAILNKIMLVPIAALQQFIATPRVEEEW